MRHAKRNQRLSRPSEHRESLLNGLVKSLIAHGQVTTTHARAKEAQRLADRLVSFGKEGSIHARRRAFRVLQDRTLVKRLFAEVAPRFVDAPGGYTRVTRLSYRCGDGAKLSLLAFSRLPATQPSVSTREAHSSAKTPASPQDVQPKTQQEAKKPEGFFEGLRKLWTRKKKGSSSSLIPPPRGQ
jgi:large subunit ribosomal protein L17